MVRPLVRDRGVRADGRDLSHEDPPDPETRAGAGWVGGGENGGIATAEPGVAGAERRATAGNRLAEARSGGGAACQGGGGVGDTVERRVPGQYEPRDPHTAQWCIGHAGTGPKTNPDAGAGGR